MSNKTFPRLLSLFCAAFALASCQSQPKAPSQAVVNEAKWESRLRIRDLNKKSSQSASVDVLARKKTKEMRLEMSALMGVPVASFVMNDSEFSGALYRQKQFIQGPLSERALQPVLRIPLSPQLIRDLVFDEAPRGGDWRCQRESATQLVSTCQSKSRQLDVSWDRKSELRTARVRHPNFEIDWVFQPPSTEVQFKDGTFVLSPPQGFRVIQL